MRFVLRPALWLGFLLLSATAAVSAQEGELPEALKDKAFTLSIQATLMKDAETVAWESQAVRTTVPGSPVAIKLVGTNVVIMVQLTPYDDGKGSVLLVTQGQVWIKKSPGEVIYRTNLDSVNVRFGESFYYYPFGLGEKGAPPLKVKISINPYDSTEGRLLRAKAAKEAAGQGSLPMGSGDKVALPPPPPPPPASTSGKAESGIQAAPVVSGPKK